MSGHAAGSGSGARSWIRRLASRLRGGSGGATPASRATRPAPPVTPAQPPSGVTPIPADRIDALTACPVCGGTAFRQVSPFNRLVLAPWTPDDRAVRYRYSLCRACGVVFAALRPGGPRIEWLIGHFEEALGRADVGETREGKYAITSSGLSDEQRDRLRALAAPGVFVSEHSGISRKAYLPGLMGDRLATSAHVELLTSLLDLRGARVLEVRSRLGSISAGLQRLCGALPHAMALFPNQQFLIQEVYGIPASVGIDFEHFSVPFEGPFDLVVANHMLTHALRPSALLATIHASLAPGGHLYVFNEPDEREYLADGKSMFNTLNPFHMQAFDGPSLGRALEANGFAVRFSTLYQGSRICLAQKVERRDDWERIPNGSRSRREKAYALALERALLGVPPHARGRLDEPWEAILERGRAAGLIDESRKGAPKLTRAPK